MRFNFEAISAFIRSKNVIELKVFDGTFKPYFYKGKAYRRSDSATIEVDDYDIKPNYKTLDRSITVELPTTKAEHEVTSEEAKIIDALKGGMLLSSSEIADTTGFSKGKVLRLLKNLTGKNYVLVSGGGRSTRYKLH